MLLGWDSTATARAKALFGCPARVATAIWVLSHETGSFIQQEAQDSVSTATEGIARTAVRTALNVLTDDGLLTKVPDANRLYYTRADHPMWAAWEAIAIALGVYEVDGAGQRWNDEPTYP